MSYPVSKEVFIKMYCDYTKDKKNMEFVDALYACLEKAYDDGFEAGMKKAGEQHE